MERCLGYADHRRAEPGVHVSAQPRPAVRVEVDVAVDDQQVELSSCAQHGADGGQLPGGELTRPVRCDFRQVRDVSSDDGGEARAGGDQQSGRGAAGHVVVDVDHAIPFDFAVTTSVHEVSLLYREGSPRLHRPAAEANVPSVGHRRGQRAGSSALSTPTT